MRLIVIVCSLLLFGWTIRSTGDRSFERKDRLSEFGFFIGALKDLKPAADVHLYEVNTPLFSNYAEKSRFIRLPSGEAASYNDSVAFQLPVGTVLIKNFFFPLDFRKPDKARRIIETRVLVRQEKGWEAWPYRWNEEQTEAEYDPAGDRQTISYVDHNGKKRTVEYNIPDKNQCKGCHTVNKKMEPIGVSARQLNGRVNVGGIAVNQLEHWRDKGLLNGWDPMRPSPALKVWNDPASGTLEERARAYLDANCGHCHSRSGPANTSGLYLDIGEKDALHLGIHKTPVAAGRGAGDLKHDIVPGKPDQSILLFRMKTNDPAIAMPEIGREQIHQEGVALIEEWIRKMDD